MPGRAERAGIEAVGGDGWGATQALLTDVPGLSVMQVDNSFSDSARS